MNFILEEFRRAHLEPDAQQIAEAIWLAKFYSPATAAQQVSDTGAQKKVQASVVGPIEQEKQKQPPPVTAAPASGVAVPGFVPIYATGEAGALPLRTPGGSALPGSLDLGRAMRPLMRKVPSRTKFVLNVEATVRRVTELGMWDAVLRPARTRWLSAAVVVDTSEGMAVWRHTTAEFVRLLSRQGAFRDVRTWCLDTSSPANPVLYNGTGSTVAHPSELFDPTGRRVVLVISDFSAKAWYGAELPDMLNTLGKRHPCVLIHVLPQSLWPRTGLARTTDVRIRSTHPGSPNARLVDEVSARRLKRLGVEASLPFPVATLERDYIYHWAGLVSGSPAAAPVAVAFVPDELGLPQKVQTLTPEQLLKRFETISSREAIQLMRLFAAVPLTLPIMRLVQRTMLPASRQSHLAEVLLSGVLQPQPANGDVDADHVVYEFAGNLREALLDKARVSDSAMALQAVLSYRIEANLGTTVDFLSMLRYPDLVKDPSIPISDQPFARIATQVLRRLGGKYADLASKMTRGIGDWLARPPEDVAGLAIENFGEYLQLFWRWPQACTRAWVVLRKDRFAMSSDDPAAAFRFNVRKGDLEAARLMGIPKGVWYFTCFAVYQQKGVERESSAKELGCRARFNVREIVRVNYEIRRMRFPKRWWVVLHCTRSVEVPPTVLVARTGDIQPMHRGQGTEVSRFAAALVAAGEDLTLAFHTQAEGGFTYRLFLAEARRDNDIQIVDPPVRERHF